MKVIGITGGIASGKSHVLSKVKSMGAYVLDCDTIVRELSRPGYPLHTIIIKEFGEDYLKEDGTIDKAKLRKTVFSDDSQLERLNKVSGDIIRTAIKEQLIEAEDYTIVFVEGIRVFEEDFRNIFDEIWFVYCDEAEQLRRLMDRDQINVSQAMEILERQKDLMANKKNADIIIDTNCDISELFKKVEKLYVELNSEKRKKRKKR